jgi:hypothetical protein
MPLLISLIFKIILSDFFCRNAKIFAGLGIKAKNILIWGRFRSALIHPVLPSAPGGVDRQALALL